MNDFPQTVTPRQIQRNYRKIFDSVKKNQKPVIVMNKNEPDVAIVPLANISDPFVNTDYSISEKSNSSVLRDLSSKAEKGANKEITSENFRANYELIN